MTNTYDVFFSYRRSDLTQVQPLLDAMAVAGLKVWRDESSIPDSAPITREIREGLAACKALLAFYSLAYPLSTACQQELTLAYVAAQRSGESPTQRVLILNPENSFDHLPILLRDHQAFQWTEQSRLDEIADRILNRVRSLNGTLAAAVRPLPQFYGFAAIQASRFIGRYDELWALHGELTANRISIVSSIQGQCVTQIRALGGNGKTLLAREYTIRFGAAYPGGIFWLNAYGNDDSVTPLNTTTRDSLRHDQMRRFAIGRDVPVDGMTPEQIEARFWNQLSCRGEPCLWIVDDLPSTLTSADLERRWCAQWVGASTLITTRTREHGSLGTCLELGVLKSDEAVELLQRHRLPDSNGEELAARKIAEVLGNHPLALEVAGSYLAKGMQTFHEYLNDLGSPDRDVLELGAQLRASLPTGHERSISRTLSKSIALLSPPGLEFFRIASLLAPAPIPVSLIKETFSAWHVTAQDVDQVFQDALDQGDTLGLCDSAGVDGRAVHTLISRVVRFREPVNEDWGAIRRSVLTALLGRLSSLADIRVHASVSREVVHARYLLAKKIDDENDARVALWVARYDFDRGDYTGARQLQERVLEAYRCLRGESHPDTVTAMNNLANTLNAQGSLTEARELLETAAKLHRGLHGNDHPDTPMAMSNLAGVLFAQEDLVGARALQDQAFLDIRRILGDKHNNTLTVMLNLSVTMQAQGELAGARQLQEFVLSARQQTLGDDHPHTLDAAGNLATTLAAQGHVAEARKLKEEVLGNTRRIRGDYHPATLHVMFNLASTLLAQGDLVAARNLNERIFEANRRTLGESHPDTLGAMNNLAMSILEQGDRTGARVILEKLITLRDRVFGPEHPDTLSAKNNLALTYFHQGDYQRARQMQTEILDALVRRLGPAHPNTLTTKGTLAYILFREGEVSKALDMQEQVLNETRRVLGEDHSDTLRASNNLALMLKDQGDVAKARVLEETVWARSRITLGAEHPNTLTAMNNLADTLSRQGDLPGAVALYDQLVALRISIFGERHPDTLVAKNNLAAALHSQGHSQRAAILGEEVLESSRRILGDEHPNTLKAMENLAEMLNARGDRSRAAALRKDAAKIRKRSRLDNK